MTRLVREESWSSSWVCVGAHMQDPQEAAFSIAVIVPDDLYSLTDDSRFAALHRATVSTAQRKHSTMGPD